MVLSVICGKLLRDAIQPLCLPDSHEQATNQNVFYELLHSIKGHARLGHAFPDKRLLFLRYHHMEMDGAAALFASHAICRPGRARSVSACGENYAHSLAPPLPTQPASLGLRGGPIRTPFKARGRGAGKRKTSGQNVSRLTFPGRSFSPGRCAPGAVSLSIRPAGT